MKNALLVLLALVVIPARSSAPRHREVTQDAKSTASDKQPEVTEEAMLQFGEELVAFRRINRSLDADEASRQWLMLAHRCFEMRKRGMVGIGFEETVAALPPPSAWPELIRRIEAQDRQTKTNTKERVALALTAAMLQNDATKVMAAWRRLRPIAASSKYPIDETAVVASLEQTVGRSYGDWNPFLQSIDRLLAGKDPDWNANEPYGLPDLVSLLGRSRAKAILHRALLRKDELKITSGDTTRRLAAQLALELLPKLKYPQWSLVEYGDVLRLFEGMEARFVPRRSALSKPKSKSAWKTDDSEYASAASVYIGKLISDGEVTRAVKLLKSHAGQGLPDLSYSFATAPDFASREQATSWKRIITQLARKDSRGWWWGRYAAELNSAGLRAEAVVRLREASGQPNLSEQARDNLRIERIHLLLSLNRLNEAIALAREDIKYHPGDLTRHSSDLGLPLMRAGVNLHSKEMMLYGWKMVDIDMAADDDNSANFDALIGSGHAPDIERVLLKKIKQTRDDEACQGYLTALVTLYYRTGRDDKALHLFRESKFWDATDLASIDFDEVYQRQSMPLSLIAAGGLAKEGHRDEATRITERVLEKRGDLDEAYELYLELKGAGSIPLLDRMIAANPLEERPLIWKAKALLGSGNLAEAERAARQANAIDPTDSEQRPGHRKLAFSTLADIREAQGDLKEAASLRRIVKSTRLAEQAALLRDAEMTNHAIRLCRDALTLNPSDYSIESQFAGELESAGQFKEAGKHRKHAFETMLSSFGGSDRRNLNSDSPEMTLAKKIGEKTLKRLVAEKPNDPKTHYLLGLLQEEKESYADAIRSYSKAVSLDRDYTPGWRKIAELCHRTETSADASVMNLLRLDGAVKEDFGYIRDLKGVWNVAERYGKPEPADSIFQLSKSQPIHREPGRRTPLYELQELDLDPTTQARLATIRRNLAGPGQFTARHSVLALALKVIEDKLEHDDFVPKG